ncbi:gustatory receptor 49 [Tribolium castaneum]|uniref:Gustatory receptor n=1 Tax=Tribolium castaneum TaxID=7070 RepID=D2A4L2_TRICA|nr:gustatory receptor 49 [Tribolium castaneum]
MDLEMFGIFLTLADKFSGKVWPIVIVIIYIFAEFYSIKYREFYVTFKPIVKLLHSFTDLSLFLCNTYLILGLNFWKKGQWSEFWANLKLVKGKRMGKKRYYLELSCANLIYVLIVFYVVFYWYQEFPGDFFHRYLVRIIENHCVFLYNYFICTILVMLASGYQNLKSQLRNGRLKTVAFRMTMQKKTLELFNQTFGWSLFLVITQCISHTLQHLSNFIYHSHSFQIILVIVVSLFVQLIPMVTLIFLCGRVMEERKKIIKLTYEMDPSFGKSPEIVSLIRKTEIKITAANFFVLDKSTILGVLETIVAFVIVLAQFRT